VCVRESECVCVLMPTLGAHGTAGFTGFSAGRVNQRYVYIPISEMCKAKKVQVDPKSRMYNRMRVHTGQPDLLPQSLRDGDGEELNSAGPNAKGVESAVEAPS
jgi:hypothetical protein